MTFMVWTADLDTGINLVDEQHRDIVASTNQLFDAKQRNEPLDVLVGHAQRVVDVTIRHFRDEEALMQKAGYEYFDIHKGIHDRLLLKLATHVDRLRSGLETPEPMLEAMDNWLYMHIQNNDRGYIPSVKSTPASA